MTLTFTDLTPVPPIAYVSMEYHGRLDNNLRSTGTGEMFMSIGVTGGEEKLGDIDEIAKILNHLYDNNKMREAYAVPDPGMTNPRLIDGNGDENPREEIIQMPLPKYIREELETLVNQTGNRRERITIKETL